MKKSSKANSKKQPAVTPEPNGDEYRSMVAEAAYYRAEKRGFVSGSEYQDWIEAENEIASTLRQQ